MSLRPPTFVPPKPSVVYTSSKIIWYCSSVLTSLFFKTAYFDEHAYNYLIWIVFCPCVVVLTEIADCVFFKAWRRIKACCSSVPLLRPTRPAQHTTQAEQWSNEAFNQLKSALQQEVQEAMSTLQTTIVAMRGEFITLTKTNEEHRAEISASFNQQLHNVNAQWERHYKKCDDDFQMHQRNTAEVVNQWTVRLDEQTKVVKKLQTEASFFQAQLCGLNTDFQMGKQRPEDVAALRNDFKVIPRIRENINHMLNTMPREMEYLNNRLSDREEGFANLPDSRRSSLNRQRSSWASMTTKLMSPRAPTPVFKASSLIHRPSTPPATAHQRRDSTGARVSYAQPSSAIIPIGRTKLPGYDNAVENSSGWLRRYKFFTYLSKFKPDADDLEAIECDAERVHDHLIAPMMFELGNCQPFDRFIAFGTRNEASVSRPKNLQSQKAFKHNTSNNARYTGGDSETSGKPNKNANGNSSSPDGQPKPIAFGPPTA